MWRSASAGASTGLPDIEPEPSVRAETFCMHPREDRNVDIDVVVHLHPRFRFGLAEDPAHVLDEAPLEGERKGEKERVEWRTVKSFAKEASGGDEEDASVTAGPLELLDHLGSRLLPHSALQDEGLVSPRREALHQPIDVGCPL